MIAYKDTTFVHNEDKVFDFAYKHDFQSAWRRFKMLN